MNMIKGFMTKRALLDYINPLGDYDRKEFAEELKDNIYYLSAKYQEYKAEIYESLYSSLDDIKYLILHIEDIANEALKPKAIEALDIHMEESIYSNEEILDLYNKYLEIVYKSTMYFTQVFSIARMFASMAFDCGEFPMVIGIVTGTYNGKHNGFDVKELKTKFCNMLFDLTNKYDDEWVKLKRFDLYRLK